MKRLGFGAPTLLLVLVAAVAAPARAVSNFTCAADAAVTVTDTQGFIAVPRGYPSTVLCTYAIVPATPHVGIRLRLVGTAFDIDYYDRLRVYVGPDASGDYTEYDNADALSTAYVRAQAAFVRFEANNNGDVEYGGFVIEYRALDFDCSGVGDCTGSGLCIGDAQCLCDDGYSGNDCTTFASVGTCNTDGTDSRVVLTASSGVVKSGDGDYVTDGYYGCDFLIKPDVAAFGPVYGILFTVVRMDLDPDSYDTVGVYEGTDYYGTTLFYKYGSDTAPPFVAVGGVAFVQLDVTGYGSTGFTGFEITYELTSFVPYNCSALDDCSARGECTIFAECNCDDGYYGVACENAYSCAAVADCSGHGLCVATDNCRCDQGWSGPACATPAALSVCSYEQSEDVYLPARNGTVLSQAVGQSQYEAYVDCGTIVNPGGIVPGIRLYFDKTKPFQIAAGDNLVVYEGTQYDPSKAIVNWSGPRTVAPSDVFTQHNPIYVNFWTSSASTGFTLLYEVVSFEPYNCAALNNCSGLGTCNMTAQCECNTGVSGTECNIIPPCPTLNNCTSLTNGVCIGGTSCLCNRGFNGDDCSLDDNECAITPAICANGATCINTYGSYTCECKPGFGNVNCTETVPITGFELPPVVITGVSGNPEALFNWTAPQGVSFVVLAVWGCGGEGAPTGSVTCSSCSGSPRTCNGGFGGSGGFTRKQVAVVPGATYQAYFDRYSTQFFDTDGATQLAYADCGSSGLRPFTSGRCVSGSCQCNSATPHGSGGYGEDLTNPGVLASAQGPRTSSTSTNCPDAYLDSELNLSAGRGSCQSKATFYSDGDPGMLVITPVIFKQPINLAASSFAVAPGLSVRVLDTIIISVRLQDVLGFSQFPSQLANEYAADLTVAIVDLAAPGTTHIASPVVVVSGGPSPFSMAIGMTRIGDFAVQPRYQGKPFGALVTVTVQEQLLVFPSAIAFDLAVGTNGTATVTIVNVGSTAAPVAIDTAGAPSWLKDVALAGPSAGTPAAFNLGSGTFATVQLSFLAVAIDLQTLGLNAFDIAIQRNVPATLPPSAQLWLAPVPATQGLPVLANMQAGPLNAAATEVMLQQNSTVVGSAVVVQLATYDTNGFHRTEGGDLFTLQLVRRILTDDDLTSSKWAASAVVLNTTTVPLSAFEYTCIDAQNGDYTCTVSIGFGKGVYELRWAVQQNGGPMPVSAVPLLQVLGRSCPPNQYTTSDGTQCVCGPGYAPDQSGTCTACGSSLFKPNAGNQPCQPCARNSISQGSFCQCSPNAYKDANGECQCKAGFNPAESCLNNCPKGTFFALGEDLAACQTCPNTGVACSDGILQVQNNYWWQVPDASRKRASGSVFSANTTFLPCKRTGVCFPSQSEYTNSTSPPTPACREGHDPNSPLCSVCIDGWATSGDNYCNQCWSPAASWIVLAILFLLCLFVMYFVVRRSSSETMTGTVLIRIAITYVQTNYLLGSLVASGPPVLQQVLNYPDSALNGFSFDLYPVQCALGWDYYQRWAFYMTLPVQLVFWPAVLLSVYYGVRRLGITRETVWNVYTSTVIALLFLFYTQVGTNLLSVFRCYPHEVNGVYPLYDAMNFACYTAQHNIAVGIGGALVAVYIVGIPLTGFVIIYRNRDRLQDPDVMTSYGFLYRGYRREGLAVFWELVVILRKLAIMFVVVFMTDPYQQSYTCGIILAAALVAQLLVQPYYAPRLNTAETVSLAISYMTQSLTLLYFVQGAVLSELGMAIGLLVMNLALWLFLIYLIAQSYYVEYIKKNGGFSELSRALYSSTFLGRFMWQPSSNDLGPADIAAANARTSMLQSDAELPEGPSAVASVQRFSFVNPGALPVPGSPTSARPPSLLRPTSVYSSGPKSPRRSTGAAENIEMAPLGDKVGETNYYG